MELAEAYIPIDRRLAMLEGQTLRDRTQGAALFADISGFTPLTETMAKELGPKRGAEEVTKQLNIVYSALIAEIDRYRGTVIGFSGDAITCWFEGDDGSRAITCAMATQRAMQQFATIYTPAGTVISLAIKVAIASGEVRRFRVGDPQIQYIDVLAGATLDRLAAAEHMANKGEIVASSEATIPLGDDVLVQEWRAEDEHQFAVVKGLKHPAQPTPWQEVSSSRFSEEQVRPWILPAIYERLQSGQDNFLAELRPAVALFLRFGGIDFDGDADACGKLDQYVRWVQSIVARYEGVLVQLTIGDKGAYLYCSFGALPAHDDDPYRAVSVALELQQLPPELRYISGMQMGVTRGRMRAGPYGGPTRRTYGVMGDAVNLSARLMSKAEAGQILVSDRIADAISDRFDLRYIGPMTVKGKQISVNVSQVLGRKLVTQPAANQPDTPLVGRVDEVRLLETLLTTAVQGAGQLVRLEGSAGVGKSRLAAELISQAQALNARIAQGICQSATSSAAYEPWRQIIASLVRLYDADGSPADADADARAHRLTQRVQDYITHTNPDWLLRLPLLGDLLGLPIADNATTAAFEPRLRQRALVDLVIEMIEQWASAQPLLILIDDVHVMDEASQNLTMALSRSLTALPVLLVLAHRPALADTPILPQLDALSQHHRMNLNELSAAGVAALVNHRLGAQLSTLALALVQAETQGNPFFVREFVDALREAGNLLLTDANPQSAEWVLSEQLITSLQKAHCIEYINEEWVLLPNAQLSGVDLGLPDSIQGVVLSRIDRLPETPKLTLKVASVVGSTFTLDVVAQAHPLRPSLTALNEQALMLDEREFIRAEALQRRQYAFRHTVTYDVAYETLLYDQRRQLHRAVSEAMEASAPDAITQLAYHAYIGEDWTRAMLYQFAAGQQSQKLYANRAGIEHLRKALHAAEQLPAPDTLWQRQRIHFNMGEILTTMAQYDDALRHLDESLKLADELDDNEAQARSCRWIAYVHEFRGEYSQALEWIQKGLNVLGERETAASAELRAIAGLIRTRQGNYDQALEECEACIRIAERLHDVTPLAFGFNSRAIVSFNRGNSAKAIEHFQRAAQLYEQAENIHGQAMSYNGIGNAYQNLGQLTEARHYLSRAREIFIQTGDELYRAVAGNNLGEIARTQGHLDEALRSYQEALRSFERLGASAYVMGIANMNLGATYVRRCEIGTARQHLRVSQELFASVSSRDQLPELMRHLTEAALTAGELDEAEAQAEQALALARELNARNEEGNTLRVLGAIMRARGEVARAEQALTEGLAILEDVGYEYDAARARMALAELWHAQGQHAEALQTLQQCRSVFERLGAVIELEAIANHPILT